jgi:BirA family transcriptional regulator, biotin operon repressor / biotin---[acetyl-CoA-carboxylase] ligase
MSLDLIDSLSDGAWHSGEALAAAADISRAAVAKRVDKLRELGLDVEARHGLGYRLRQPLERLRQSELQANAPAGLLLRVVDSIDSTNRSLIEADATDDPQLLFAEFQSAGRGRRGRVWRSPYGANLYGSLAWSFPGWPPGLTTLPLMVGVACAQALGDVGLDRLRLKWPNDLWVDGRKLGGILVEHRGEAGGACRVVIGIGLNVAMSPAQAEGIDQPWISVNEVRGHMVSRNALAQALAQRLHRALLDFSREGFAPFAAQWQALDLSRDQPVRISGAENFDGIARGIDGDGALCVDCGGVIRKVHSGDVSLRLEPA